MTNEELGLRLLGVMRGLSRTVEALESTGKKMPASPFRDVRAEIDLERLDDCMDYLCWALPQLHNLCDFALLYKRMMRLREAVREWDDAERIDYRIPKKVYIDCGDA